MRTSSKKLNSSLKRQIGNILSQTIADLKSEKEAKEFLNDFFTEAELETFTKRLAIGYWLKKDRSYQNIKTNLKVSSATIASVQEMLPTKGFQGAIKKIEAEEWANKWAEKIKALITPKSQK